MKKRWLISLMVLTLALATAGTVSAFALAGGGASEPVIPPGEITHGDPTYDEWILDFGDGKVVTSIDDIDPNVCNLMHNRKPCTPEEPEELGVVPHGDPAYDEWLSDFGDGKVVTSIDDIDPNVCNLMHNRKPCTPEELEELGVVPHGDPAYDEWILDFRDGIGDGKVVTSIDDIDPNVCNYIHNINACTPEELEELGNLAARSWIVDPDTADEPGEGGVLGPGGPVVVEGEGEPEPAFVDGEPMYEVQSHEEVVEQDCGLAGGTLHVSSDGEIWCVFVHDLEDGGKGETQAQPPVVAPEPEPLPAK